MGREVLVVGGGMAGLTTAAYLARAGIPVTLCEAQKSLGGLVASFSRGGFTFDAGIRAIESSGIVRPMLRELGIDLDFLPSPVSVGIGADTVRLSGEASLGEYRDLLVRAFPDSAADVDRIVAEVRKVMDYMAVLYGIDNPLFMDLRSDPAYLRDTIFPWMVKYLLTMPKVAKLKLPVEEHLATLTANQALLDLVAQHFFKATPAYFALSYFSLYLDYAYPKGGTASLPRALEVFARGHGATLVTEAPIVAVDLSAHLATDSGGRTYEWSRLVWTADQKALYRALLPEGLPDRRTKKAVEARRRLIEPCRGGDSIFTLYISTSLPPAYFADRASAHFFHTPTASGLSACPPKDWSSREGLEAWAHAYLGLTTYELSFPALRDPSLAPPGQMGLVASSLMDYDFFLRARQLGVYPEVREYCAARILEVLEGSAFPGLGASVLEVSTSTPLSLEALTGNADGAITGWAFTNPEMPAVHSLPGVARSIRTPLPGVYQAGQWTFSPSGLPISILTGKLAADRVVKDLRSGRA